ncbi:uncharacterized protein [Gossypium hirsutum]|uniref:1-phosphatidylinositol-4,5-bisphosphate phosphodiesterase beta-2 n=1 Tax=Gossypium hirsutum TaxID=3635 RepID=A0A1U8KM15_GOSHI|nr:uncharacterized protein LOC107917173 [Gossypium hirsutum]
MPNLDTSVTPVSPAIETRSQSRSVGDDALFQAMLRILERVARPHSGSGDHGLVTKRLWYNGAEMFRGVTGVAPTVTKYWLEATKRIMNDLDCTLEQKFKGVVSLLRDNTYWWWLTVEEGDKSVVEYEAKFLRLSCYARGMVAFGYERCIRFEDGLRDNLRVLITPQRKQEFAVLLENAEIAEDVKRVERQNRDRESGNIKKDSEPSSSVQRPKKKSMMGLLE